MKNKKNRLLTALLFFLHISFNVHSKTYNFEELLVDIPLVKSSKNRLQELLSYGISDDEKVEKVIIKIYEKKNIDSLNAILISPDEEKFNVNLNSNNIIKKKTNDPYVQIQTYVEYCLKDIKLKDPNGLWNFETLEEDDRILKWEVSIITNKPNLIIDDFHITNQDKTLEVPAPELEIDDIERPNNKESVELINSTKFGNLSLKPDGAFVYIPNSGFAGMDEFSYKVITSTDYKKTQTVTIIVNPKDENNSLPKYANLQSAISENINMKHTS